jgi:hypothetical protein
MRGRGVLFGILTAVSVTGATLSWVLVQRGGAPAGAFRAALFVGRPLLELRAPAPDAEVPIGGVDVLVRFRDADVLPATFRCWLNGVDVTDQLTLGQNGAGGAVAPLREGENALRVEVFGRGWLVGRYYLDEAELRLHVRPPLHLDQA